MLFYTNIIYMFDLEQIKMGLSANKYIILAISLLFIGMAVYVYIYYVSPKLNPSFVPNREFVKEEDSVKSATLYLFYANWCPISKKALPIFNTLKTKLENNKINDVTVHLVTINGESEEEQLIEFEKNYKVKIDGYPTIYLVKGEEVVEYDAITTEDTLNEFLRTTL